MGDPAELGMHAGGVDHCLRLSGHDRGPGQHDVLCVERRVLGAGLGRARLGQGFTGDRCGVTRSANALIRRQSAGTKLPSSSKTMSPGTRSVARISTTAPPRSVWTICGSSWRSAAMAFSALYSCQKENTPLMTMTPTMATPRWAIPWWGSKYSATKGQRSAYPEDDGKEMDKFAGEREQQMLATPLARRGSVRIPPGDAPPRPGRGRRPWSSGWRATARR